MKLKLITLTTDLQQPGFLKFKKSLDDHGFDYHVIFQQIPEGTHVFGTQMPLVYEYLKELQAAGEYTHVIYADAWDSLILGTWEELIDKCPGDSLDFFGSAEKACFPHPELAASYPEAKSDWKFVNGGGWYAKISYFIEWYDKVPAVGVNDQLWLTQRFLEFSHSGDWVKLDTECKIFQTTGFEGPDDFSYAANANPERYGRLINQKTATLPIIIHGNGRTDMTKVWALMPKTE
jgi:hypothetical protein